MRNKPKFKLTPQHNQILTNWITENRERISGRSPKTVTAMFNLEAPDEWELRTSSPVTYRMEQFGIPKSRVNRKSKATEPKQGPDLKEVPTEDLPRVVANLSRQVQDLERAVYFDTKALVARISELEGRLL
jgi:hypothetical protein